MTCNSIDKVLQELNEEFPRFYYICEQCEKAFQTQNTVDSLDIILHLQNSLLRIFVALKIVCFQLWKKKDQNNSLDGWLNRLFDNSFHAILTVVQVVGQGQNLKCIDEKICTDRGIFIKNKRATVEWCLKKLLSSMTVITVDMYPFILRDSNINNSDSTEKNVDSSRAKCKKAFGLEFECYALKRLKDWRNVGFQESQEKDNATLFLVSEQNANNFWRNGKKITELSGEMKNNVATISFCEKTGLARMKFSNVRIIKKIENENANSKGKENVKQLEKKGKVAQKLYRIIFECNIGTVIFDNETVDLRIEAVTKPFTLLSNPSSQRKEATPYVCWGIAFNSPDSEYIEIDKDNRQFTWSEFEESFNEFVATIAGISLNSFQLEAIREIFLSSEERNDPEKNIISLYTLTMKCNAGSTIKFWDWLLNCFDIIEKPAFIEYFNQKWFCAFSTRKMTEVNLRSSPNPTMLIRFSTTGILQFVFSIVLPGNIPFGEPVFHHFLFTLEACGNLNLYQCYENMCETFKEIKQIKFVCGGADHYQSIEDFARVLNKKTEETTFVKSAADRGYKAASSAVAGHKQPIVTLGSKVSKALKKLKRKSSSPDGQSATSLPEYQYNSSHYSMNEENNRNSVTIGFQNITEQKVDMQVRAYADEPTPNNLKNVDQFILEAMRSENVEKLIDSITEENIPKMQFEPLKKFKSLSPNGETATSLITFLPAGDVSQLHVSQNAIPTTTVNNWNSMQFQNGAMPQNITEAYTENVNGNLMQCQQNGAILNQNITEVYAENVNGFYHTQPHTMWSSHAFQQTTNEAFTTMQYAEQIPYAHFMQRSPSGFSQVHSIRPNMYCNHQTVFIESPEHQYNSSNYSMNEENNRNYVTTGFQNILDQQVDMLQQQVSSMSMANEEYFGDPDRCSFQPQQATMNEHGRQQQEYYLF